MTIDRIISEELIPYQSAIAIMEERVAAIKACTTRELIWLLEHPHLYSAGISAKPQDLFRNDVPIYNSRRGGQYTYHGPSVQIAYLMLNLKRIYGEKPDVRRFVCDVERVIIELLAELGIEGFTAKGRVGVWVRNKADGKESKIAAIGIKISRWISYHGFAINNNPDLSYFDGIVPCGISQYGVTSIAAMGVVIKNSDLNHLMIDHLEKMFDCK